MRASNFPNTLILNYWDSQKILNNQSGSILDKFDINQYQYIVGPHLINQNHWIAIIIDVELKHFYSLDPLKYRTNLLEQHFDNWIQFCSRFGKSDFWKQMTIDHPIQTDSYNCGIFVMIFIANYINTGKIEFDSDSFNMNKFRHQIAYKIKNFA